MPIFAAMKKVVVRANCVVFFGSDLSQDQDFVRSALEFPEDVFKAAEILRLMPGFIAPYVFLLSWTAGLSVC